MRAFQITEPHKAEVVDLPVPEPGPDEVLVRMHYAGICGSDLHTLEGKHARRTPPLITGHEGSGVVEKVGTNVKDIKPGTECVILAEQSCGECRWCREGHTNLCARKVLLGTKPWPGTFSEYVVAPAANILPLPKGLSLRLAAVTEPVAICMHVLRQAGWQGGESALIYGAGGIGSLLLAACRARGMKSAVVADIKEFNVEKAREMGATTAINNGTPDDAEQALQEACGPEGVDVTFVTAHPVKIVNQSFRMTRKRGTVTLVAQFNQPGIVDIDKARIKEQTLVSSAAANRKDFEEALEILAAYPEYFEPAITTEVGLDEVDDLLHAMIEGKANVAKAIVRLAD